jgi:plasmid stability protein
MPNLSIKDVPEAWAQALRERAARNHRSLQGELMALIQGAVAPEAGELALANMPANPNKRSTIVGFDRFGHPIVRQGWKTVEQIAAELREKPTDLALRRGLPLGVDIIREERDAR